MQICVNVFIEKFKVEMFENMSKFLHTHSIINLFFKQYLQ